MRVPPPIAIAFRALRRNRLQTSLTIVGMTIGVAAVLAMIAIGTGAEAAIEDQIRAAGMNLIVVTAGNYKVKATEDFGGGAVEPSAALRSTAPEARYARYLAQPFRAAGPADSRPDRLRAFGATASLAEARAQSVRAEAEGLRYARPAVVSRIAFHPE